LVILGLHFILSLLAHLGCDGNYSYDNWRKKWVQTEGAYIAQIVIVLFSFAIFSKQNYIEAKRQIHTTEEEENETTLDMN
jgi:septation ring formation regulator EzrA